MKWEITVRATSAAVLADLFSRVFCDGVPVVESVYEKPAAIPLRWVALRRDGEPTGLVFRDLEP